MSSSRVAYLFTIFESLDRAVEDAVLYRSGSLTRPVTLHHTKDTTCCISVPGRLVGCYDISMADNIRDIVEVIITDETTYSILCCQLTANLAVGERTLILNRTGNSYDTTQIALGCGIYICIACIYASTCTSLTNDTTHIL